MNIEIIEHRNSRFSEFKRNEDETIRTFVFKDKTEIRWDLEGKELIVNGCRYDVIEISYGKEIVIKCYEDKVEEFLLTALNKISGNQNGNNQNTHKNNFGFLYFAIADIYRLSIHHSLNYELFSPDPSLQSSFFALISPPPEC